MAKIESDEALVRRFHAGDDSAFDLLCERYRKSVYTSCYAILVGEELATDVASKTFTEAMRELRRGHVPADPRVWLRKKAHLLAMDRADPRMERRSRSVDIDPEWQVAVGERGQLVWDAVTSLSLSHRKVLNLRVPLELSTGDIAEVLGIDRDRAQRLMNEADRELRAALVALVVARSARRECGALDGVLSAAGWTAGHFSAESRTYRTVADHIDGCDTCAAVRARTYLASDWLRIVIPLLAVPEELVRRIVEETQDLVVRATGLPATSSTALASTGVSVGQPLNKLVQIAQSGRAAVTTTASRVAVSPVFSRAVHAVQENPVIARTAGLAATLVLLGPLVLVGSEPGPSTPGPGTIVASPPAEQNPFPPEEPPSPPPSPPADPPADPASDDPASYPIRQASARVLTVPPDLPPPGTLPPQEEPRVDPTPPATVPPTSDPPTSDPPTSDPPTSDPPTSDPPTSDPPTSDPPTSDPPTSDPPTNDPPVVVLPPKWGYTFGSPNLAPIGAENRLTTNQWGSWKNDPDRAVAGRVPTMAHEAVGTFRVRFPAIGSAKGLAHVTVAWWSGSDSCVVRDLDIVDGDELVRINCVNAAGAPKDVNFNLMFAEAGTDAQPMATVHYDGTGNANDRTVNTTGGEVHARRNGTGKYTAVLDGDAFDRFGYAQITARGNTPARCQNAGVDKVGTSVLIEVHCYGVSAAAPPTDTEWMLTYLRRGPLNPGKEVPTAYVQTNFTPPGLRVDPARSYNSAGGAMTVLRDSIGNYRVGFKGLATAGNLFQVVAVGPAPGQCNAGGWGSPTPGEAWVAVYCYTAAGLVDRPFGVAMIRMPGGATGPLNPIPPDPDAAGPKWAHARVNLAANNIPLDIETEVDPEEQWGTWARNLSEVDARWARRATVIHEGVGLFRVRLPGVGSPVGIAHVTPSRFYSVSGNCSVRGYRQVGVDGIDEEVSVACFYGFAGHPAAAGNVPFSVLFTAPPASSGTPAATIRYGADTSGDTVNSTGRPIRVERTGVGTYVATVDGPEFDARGYLQVTPFTPDNPGPVWCRATGTERTADGMRISLACWDFAGIPAQPRDAQWLLTYVQGAPLTHDPGIPGAYLRTTRNAPALSVDPAYSYTSTGGDMRVLRLNPGQYWVGFRGVGNAGNTFQVSMTGSQAGQCHDSGYDHYPETGVAWVMVNCYDATRRFADLPFSVAILRSPYGALGSLTPVDPGPHPPVPRWGYASMNASEIPLNTAETVLNPSNSWGTWVGAINQYAAKWLAPSTVVHESPGTFRVRLPNVGSAAGIPHVTMFLSGAAGSDSCVVLDFTQSGADELVRVRCFDKAGQPKDVRFVVFFGDPANTVHTAHLATGHYRATVDGAGLDPTGYAQITPLGPGAVRCRNAGVEKLGTSLSIDVECDSISAASSPADSDFLLTYVQGTPLSRDSRIAGAYAQTTTAPGPPALDHSRSYNSTGGAITLEALATGRFRLRFTGVGRVGDDAIVNGSSVQVVTLGQNPGSCYTAGWGHQDYYSFYTVAEAVVACYDPSGKPADVPFGMALVRRP